MFSIETTDDIKILKELTNFSSDSRIKELELEVQRLSEINEELLNTSKEQAALIKKISDSFVTSKQCRDIVFDLVQNRSSRKNLSKEGKASIVTNKDGDEINLTTAMRLSYSTIVVKGNTLINHTKRNQDYLIPITTLELLALMEIYQYRERKLLYKDQKNICKLFNINKVQFGKIYFNIKNGVFFDALNSIDNKIKQTSFKIKDGSIWIIDKGKSYDTKIDKEKFNYLVNVYVNSNQPYAAVYKLSKEETNIDPIHLLTVLRKHEKVSELVAML